MALALALACGGGGDGDDGASDDAATSAADGSGTADGGSGDDGSASESGGGGGSAEGGSGGGTEAGSATGDGSTDGDTGVETTGMPVECGEQTCDAGTFCIVPCCGGPAPQCKPLPNPDDTCPDGQVGCKDAQTGAPGCYLPCVADPSYCAPADQVTCPEGSFHNCTVEGGCYGDVDSSGTLSCSCK